MPEILKKAAKTIQFPADEKLKLPVVHDCLINRMARKGTKWHDI